MSFEGDTSEGSKNSNSNDGGGGADADLVYFDESEMRYASYHMLHTVCNIRCISYVIQYNITFKVITMTTTNIRQMDRPLQVKQMTQNVRHQKEYQRK